MIPNWNIGPVARRRLAEMARAGWDDHKIYNVGSATAGVYVEVDTVENDGFIGRAGNTIGLAVANVYKAWKKHRGQHWEPELIPGVNCIGEYDRD